MPNNPRAGRRLPVAPALRWEPLDKFYNDPLKAAHAPDDSFVKVTGIDLAGVDNSSTGGSYHALVTVLYNTLDGNIYIVDAERARNLTREDLVSFVRRHLDRNNPDLTVLEEASTGGYVGGLLSRTTRYPVRMVQPKTSKEERALQVIGLAEGGKIHSPLRAPWGDMLRAELADFPGRYTDLVDSLVWALLYCRQLAAARREDSFYARQLDGFSLFGR
jgi:predicted phage terminase large subunit-like protein